jgi:hypothetical protein
VKPYRNSGTVSALTVSGREAEYIRECLESTGSPRVAEDPALWYPPYNDAYVDLQGAHLTFVDERLPRGIPALCGTRLG